MDGRMGKPPEPSARARLGRDQTGHFRAHCRIRYRHQFFPGNHPPHFDRRVNLPDDDGVLNWDESSIAWKEILPKSPLDAAAVIFIHATIKETFTPIAYTFIRMAAWPGFVCMAKFIKDWSRVEPQEDVDLAAAINGDRPSPATTCSSAPWVI